MVLQLDTPDVRIRLVLAGCRVNSSGCCKLVLDFASNLGSWFEAAYMQDLGVSRRIPEKGCKQQLNAF